MNHSRTAIATAVAVAFFAAAPGARAESAIRSAAAVKRTGDVAVDGRLAELDWQGAPVSSGFWERQPNEGESPDFATEFRVLYDDDALYVGVRAHDDQPELIKGLLTRRDQASPSDWVFIAIDSYNDRRTAFMFALNPAGVQRDVLMFDDVNEDESWNAVWQGASNVDDRGWTAEFRIPYNQLRFGDQVKTSWGFQVAREVQRTGEVSFWTPIPTAKPRMVSMFGAVEGMAGIGGDPRVELRPYSIGGARFAEAGSEDPFNGTVEPELGVGVDFKYGVTNDLTLSGTINPDFGQVEADPSQVNLTANEVFFREQRPFFVEGSEIFRFSLGAGDNNQEQLFYSRRIGAPPHASGLDVSEFSQEDQFSNILGALKLSGKTRSGWSFGVLDALTQQEQARIVDDGGGKRSMIIEPLTNYSVAKVKRDFNNGRTTVGATYTGVHRDLRNTGLEWLHEQAYAGGVEIDHRFEGDVWSVSGRASVSHVRGSADAIANTQRASQRFFQRPDNEHVDFDPTRTSLTGSQALVTVSRHTKHVRSAVGFDTRSPEYEVNDLGFQRESDFMVGWFWTQFTDQSAGKYLRDWRVNINTWTAQNYGLENLNNGGNVNGGFNLSNMWGAHGGVGINQYRRDTRLLRGGPSVAWDPEINSWLNLWSDRRKPLRAGVWGNYGVQPGTDSWAWAVGGDFTVQARSNLALTLGPWFNRRGDNTQYVTEATDMEGAPHYILGRIDQTTLGMIVRLNYTVMPGLSLQAYAQPFISAGRYKNFREVVSPDADDFDDRFRRFDDSEVAEMDGDITVNTGASQFAFGRPDFNFRELRSTVVARWEYQPGSTLFFIWSQSRGGSISDGRFRLGDDFTDLLSSDSEHVALVKFTYWWAP